MAERINYFICALLYLEAGLLFICLITLMCKLILETLIKKGGRNKSYLGKAPGKKRKGKK